MQTINFCIFFGNKQKLSTSDDRKRDVEKSVKKSRQHEKKKHKEKKRKKQKVTVLKTLKHHLQKVKQIICVDIQNSDTPEDSSEETKVVKHNKVKCKKKISKKHKAKETESDSNSYGHRIFIQ